MAAFNLSIVTPTGSVVDTEIDEVSLPGAEGEFGVLPAHQSALIMLGGGLVSFRGSEGEGRLLIRGGVVEIRPDAVLVLTDRAENPEDVDRVEVQAMLDMANADAGVDVVLDDAAVLRLAAQRGYAEAALRG